MVYQHKIQRRIEFSETDLAGIVHFSNFFRFMEAAEHDLLRSLGQCVVEEHDEQGRPQGWPRRDCRCEYLAPLKFEDVVDIQLVIRRIRSAGIDYEFTFHCAGKLVARGAMGTTFAVFGPERGDLQARLIPSWVTEQLCEAPAKNSDSL
jgi:YbgC/YbaW family acyl-CoA thioester hydrolase